MDDLKIPMQSRETRNAERRGMVLGISGYGLFAWQRRAARRGSKGAQTGALRRCMTSRGCSYPDHYLL